MKRKVEMGIAGILMVVALGSPWAEQLLDEIILSPKFRYVYGPMGTATTNLFGVVQGIPGGTFTLTGTVRDISGRTMTTTGLNYQHRNIVATWTVTGGATFTTQTGWNTVLHLPSAEEATYTVVFSVTEGSRTFGVPPVTSVATTTKVATITVAVSVPRVVSIQVSPGSATSQVTGTQAFSLLAWNQGGQPMPEIVGTWSGTLGLGTFNVAVGSSCQLNVGTTAMVGTIGVTVVNRGNTFATIATITVLPGPLAQIMVSPSSATVDLESAKTFTATGKDAYGNLRSDVFNFSLTGDPIGTINPTVGIATVFTGTAAGTGVLHAGTGSVLGTATITVVIPPAVFQPIPSPQTAGTGFVVTVRIFGYSGVATVSSTGTVTPGTLTVINGWCIGTVTVSRTGTQTITVTWPNGSVTSNEFLVVAGPIANLILDGIPEEAVVGFPWTGTMTGTFTDACGNVAKTPAGGQTEVSFVGRYSWNGGITWLPDATGLKYTSANTLSISAGNTGFQLAGANMMVATPGGPGGVGDAYIAQSDSWICELAVRIRLP